jgi:hypothetical protein
MDLKLYALALKVGKCITKTFKIFFFTETHYKSEYIAQVIYNKKLFYVNSKKCCLNVIVINNLTKLYKIKITCSFTQKFIFQTTILLLKKTLTAKTRTRTFNFQEQEQEQKTFNVYEQKQKPSTLKN